MAIGGDSNGAYGYVANLADGTVSVLAVPLSISEQTTLLFGGMASFPTASTGVMVSISGSSGFDGTMFTVISENYGSVDPSAVTVPLGSAVYYDVQVLSLSDGTAAISITGSGQSSMAYYNGGWIAVSATSSNSGNTITGNIPVTDLQETDCSGLASFCHA